MYLSSIAWIVFFKEDIYWSLSLSSTETKQASLGCVYVCTPSTFDQPNPCHQVQQWTTNYRNNRQYTKRKERKKIVYFSRMRSVIHAACFGYIGRYPIGPIWGPFFSVFFFLSLSLSLLFWFVCINWYWPWNPEAVSCMRNYRPLDSKHIISRETVGKAMKMRIIKLKF